jgi:hypothetical protein
MGIKLSVPAHLKEAIALILANKGLKPEKMAEMMNSAHQDNPLNQYLVQSTDPLSAD